MLRERVEGTSSVGNHLAAAGAPSGVLVGVSPVNVPVADKGVKQSGVANFGLLHVLVVDDDEAVRKACCEITSGMGFALVLGAESATAAREILKHQRIDVLLLDLSLPDMSGLDVLRRIKSHHESVATLVLSAYRQGFGQMENAA